MKALRNNLLLLFVLSLSPLFVKGQDFISIFKSGSYSALSGRMLDMVDIEINRDKKTVSKSVAVNMIKNRLDQFKPVEWEMMHKGESEEKSSKYVILKATNANGEGLRVFIHIVEEGGNKIVSRISFKKVL